MNQDLKIYLYVLLSIVLGFFLTPPLLFALFEIDETLHNGNSTIWK